MDKIAIIVAAGSGTRMGSDIPKQFLPLNGKAVILHTIEAFIRAVPAIQIRLVLPPSQMEYGQSLLLLQPYCAQVILISGGSSRYQSVAHGLQDTPAGSLVAIHDGVRCLISTDLILRCFANAALFGSAIPVIAATDSLREISGSDKDKGIQANASKVVDRAKIVLVQTPQTFKTELIQNAFSQKDQPGFTDEASVVEAIGQKVHLVEGDPENIKITRPVDLILAAAILDQRGEQHK
jgi:2-C-methyl-D-erythritol 4-phosphate cytidylyltransferase